MQEGKRRQPEEVNKAVGSPVRPFLMAAEAEGNREGVERMTKKGWRDNRRDGEPDVRDYT